MRTRRALLGAGALLAMNLTAGIATVPAFAATAPAVTEFGIVGSGPDDLLRVAGTGFTPGAPVTLQLAGSTAVYPLPSIVADGSGTVRDPDGYRTPAVVQPGSYRLVMSDAAGDTAQSGPLPVSAPDLGDTVATAGSSAEFGLVGVGTSSDVVRTLTVDGTSLPSGLDTFGNTAVAVYVFLPDSIGPGTHHVRLTQDRFPAVALDATLVVPTPTLTVIAASGTAALNLLGSRNPIVAATGSFGPHASIGVSVVDAAHHAFALGTPDASGHLRVPLPGLAPGTGTVTATDSRSGASVSVPLHVGRSSVTGTLASGDQIVSPSGVSQLRIQTDGNLVLSRGPSIPRWTSVTVGHAGAHLAPGSDGSLTVVTAGAHPVVVWSSHSPTTDRPTTLTLQDDGNVVLYSAHGRALWQTHTAGGDTVTLAAGSGLGRGGELMLNADPGYSARMQVDGNFVLYHDQHGTPLWSTHTNGAPGATVTLQTDGNLVVYSVAGKALWSNHVFPGPGARLAVQGDGNFVEYAVNGQAVWSTRTAR